MPPLPDYDTALQTVLAALPGSLPLRSRPLAHSLGAALAGPLAADRDLPPFDRAAMDGYALRSESGSAGARLRVVGEAAAGASFRRIVGVGETVRISTGAPLPPGADAVIPHEQTDRAEPHVRIDIDVPAWHCVHRRAADARQGDELLAAGTVLEPHHLAIGAMVGALACAVVCGPAQTHILSSGDELVDAATPTQALRPEQIRDTALPLLTASVRAFGGEVVGARRVPDDEEHTVAAVLHALHESDALVTVGGVSAGAHDCFPRAFERARVRTLLKGASIQPGKPIFVGLHEDPLCVVVGLPGNPVSALVASHLFLWPILRKLGGCDGALPWREAELLEAVRPNPKRRAFRPCVEGEPGRVRVPAWRGSGDLAHTSPTHGVLDLPVQEAELPAGARAPFLPWAWRAAAPVSGPAANREAIGDRTP